MIYDTNSGSVNLNTNPSRLVRPSHPPSQRDSPPICSARALPSRPRPPPRSPAPRPVAPPQIPPPPPPLAITNYSYTVNRTGTILRSAVFVDGELNRSAALNTTSSLQRFSSDIQGWLSGYVAALDLPFPDYSTLRSCSPADVQAVLNSIATKYGVAPDSLSASCSLNYQKPNGGSSSSSGLSPSGRRRSLQQSGASSTCFPRITLSVSLPLGGPLSGNMTSALAAASVAADAVFAAVGGSACYVPTGSDARVGTVVTFQTSDPRATCQYLLQAFAAANNLTADQVRGRKSVSCNASVRTRAYCCSRAGPPCCEGVRL
jgi:hypothetical protein